MKQLRVIVMIPVENDIALAPLRAQLKEIIRAAGTKTFVYRKDNSPDVERSMTGHFEMAVVSDMHRRRREA